MSFKKNFLILLILTWVFQPISVYCADKAITFNFVDVELPVVAKYISDVTGRNFIFDEKFKGKVTIIAPTELTTDESFDLFTSVLELKGFTVAPSGVNAYKIIPTAMAKQQGLDVKKISRHVDGTYIARLISLNHTSSEEAVSFLKPLISRTGHISSFGPGNLILVIDSGLNIQKILKIIKNIDKLSTSNMPEIVFLKYAGADNVAEIINDGMVRGPAVLKGKNLKSGYTVKVVADTRLNAVIIFGTKEMTKSIQQLISILDVPSEKEQGRINIYFLENANAEEVSKVLQGILKAIQKTAPIPGRRPGEISQGTASGIIVTPDKSTNSLVIIASPAEYRDIISVIERLDKKKKQVYVEAMIVEASINNLLDVGLNYRAIGRHHGEPVVIGGLGIMDNTAIQSIISGLSGFSIGGLGNFLDIPVTSVDSDGTISTSNINVPGISALFNLNDFKGAVNILSTPQILTADNEEAEIVVGENIPIITKRESDPTRELSVFSSIERHDVGVKLKITPHISEGDHVSLEIFQEISSVKHESNADILISVGPTTTIRSTKTSVVVRDGETVVIGGLMQENFEDNITKIPLLGDIPILGWLFTYKHRQKSKTNLLVFMTPHIIRDADGLSDLTQSKRTEYALTEKLYDSGQVLVRLENRIKGDDFEGLLQDKNASISRYIKELDIYVVDIPDSCDTRQFASDLILMEEVRHATPYYKYRAH